MLKSFRKIALGAVAAIAMTATADQLVILHTNDTHSQIDPGGDGLGGVLRRKVLIDSIRAVEPNVILIDAGDAVQGTLFFTLFEGEVEQKLLNALGYDFQILGNHEFDNGMDKLRTQLSNANPELLATNYQLKGSALDGLFRPYAIRQVGDKRVGFLAININPEGLIDESGYEGVKYLDALKAANSMAWYLRNIEGVDLVVAISHIGYENNNSESDVELAKQSSDIDIIIGGHSHTKVDPASKEWRVKNLDGRDVVVAQTRSKGAYLGQINIDLETGEKTGRLIPVDSRLDSRTDAATAAIIEPYRHKVDSISDIVIGKSAVDFPQNSPRLLNLLSDFVRDNGAQLAGRKVDLAIMNKGGIRQSLPKGTITKGMIMSMLPFNNQIVVMEISGKDLLDNMSVMARQGGNGLSSGCSVDYDPVTARIASAKINGKPIDPEATYTLATISYLAQGGDYMEPLTHGKIIARSKDVIFNDIINAMEHGSLKGRRLNADNTPRMNPMSR